MSWEVYACVQALGRSGKLRDDIFITTKIHPQDLGYQPTMSAFENSLTAFNTDYLDLVLLHYAACFGSLCANHPQGTWRESWRALEDAVTAGRILAIGVLLVAHPLDVLLSESTAGSCKA